MKIKFPMQIYISCSLDEKFPKTRKAHAIQAYCMDLIMQLSC